MNLHGICHKAGTFYLGASVNRISHRPQRMAGGVDNLDARASAEIKSFTVVLKDLDGPWYRERNPNELAHHIEVPTYLQIAQGCGWIIKGTLEMFERVSGVKKLDILPCPPMNSCPFVDAHDEMFRWYEY